MNVFVRLSILAALIIAGCGGSSETSSNPPAVAARDSRVDENDFVPSDHDPLPTSPVVLDTVKPPAPATVIGQDTTAMGSSELIPGYRVQIYSSLNIDQARLKRAEVESLLPEEWFYLEYDPPSYKIRVGNFTTKLEADRCARALVERGVVDAWAVPARIFKSPTKRVAPILLPDPQPK